MGKLGKKARKFAKNHLQSVLKNRRKFKSMRDSFKRKNISRDEGDSDEEHVKATTDHVSRRDSEGVLANGAIGDTSLDAIFSDNDRDSIEDVSESDGFLSEDSNCPYVADSENENDSEAADKSDCSALGGQNEGIHLEVTKQKKKLERLREKDPEFSKFLESHRIDIVQIRSKEAYSDEESDASDQGEADVGNITGLHKGRVLTVSTFDTWCQLVIKKQIMSVLPNILNGFHVACRYGADDDPDAISYWRIERTEVFCKILMFVLQEADGIFRRLLGISSSSYKESILELTNTAKWKTVKPLLKSYLRSMLYLLNQVTDQKILEFTLSRLRASIVFFAAFPSLTRRLIKVAVHVWATGGGTISSSSFNVIRDVAVQLKSDCYDTCLMKIYKAFIVHCKFVESANLQHIQFLRDSVSEMYSLDMQKSYQKALISVQQLANILQQAFKTKKKETLNNVYNWQYINCLDLWVQFISSNIRDHDLQPLLYLVIQLISGVAHLFPGSRYFPLRLKCIQMLNQLSSSTGVFIPVASLALSFLEYREISKNDARPGQDLNLSSLLKVPKQFLKSAHFQEKCALSAIKLLSVHFTQWSYHISFPELATIPLICLRKFHERTTVEALRRLVKRLIDQVEQNVDFVQRKRDEVAFSPKDQESIESFLQLEKNSGNTPFIQYYASVLQKLKSRSLVFNDKTRELESKESGKQKHPVCDGDKYVKADGVGVLVKKRVNSAANGNKSKRRNKKQRT